MTSISCQTRSPVKTVRDGDDWKLFDGLRDATAEGRIFFNAPDEPAQLPITPCSAGLCPDWIPEGFETRIAMRLPVEIPGARVVDDRGNIVAQVEEVFRNPGGGVTHVLGFYPDQEFHSRSPNGTVVRARNYQLELPPTEENGPGRLSRRSSRWRAASRTDGGRSYRWRCHPSINARRSFVQLEYSSEPRQRS